MTVHSLLLNDVPVGKGRYSYQTHASLWFARVNALRNLSRKKSREVAASLLSRRCFTLCITMEVEPRIAKQYKCHHCCSCKNYRGKGMEGGNFCVFASFFLADQKIASSAWKKCVLRQHEQQVTAGCQTHSDYGPPKMSLTLAV